jgi:hypothetical protein
MRVLRAGVKALVPALMLTPLLALATAQAPAQAASSAGTVFSDGFESGRLAQWSGGHGLIVQRRDVYAGRWAARSASRGRASYALATLNGSYRELEYDVRLKVLSHSGTVTLLKLRTAGGANVLAVNLLEGNVLGYFNAVTRTAHGSTDTVTPRSWHLVAVTASIGDGQGGSGSISIAVDGKPAGPHGSDDFGSAPFGVVQLGNAARHRTYRVDFDDVMVSAPDDPPAGAFFGAWVQMADRACTSSAGQDAALAALETCDGHALGVDREYHKWDDAFPTVHEQHSRDDGRTLILSWKAQTRAGAEVHWSDIASGAQDATIDARAAGVKAFGATVYLIFHHEPEDEVGTVNGSAADFVAAWRHVHDRFAQDGVTNVRWLLDLMTWTFDPHSGRNPEDFWPGATYVDAVGADGYNWYGCRGTKWVSFGAEFSPFYDWSVSKAKPAIAVEWGSTEDPADPNRKATWIADAAAWVKAHPNMVGLTYFDSPADCTWWADTTPQSLAAFASVANDPYFQADPIP